MTVAVACCVDWCEIAIQRKGCEAEAIAKRTLSAAAELHAAPVVLEPTWRSRVVRAPSPSRGPPLTNFGLWCPFGVSHIIDTHSDDIFYSGMVILTLLRGLPIHRTAQKGGHPWVTSQKS